MKNTTKEREKPIPERLYRAFHFDFTLWGIDNKGRRVQLASILNIDFKKAKQFVDLIGSWYRKDRRFK